MLQVSADGDAQTEVTGIKLLFMVLVEERKEKGQECDA